MRCSCKRSEGRFSAWHVPGLLGKQGRSRVQQGVSTHRTSDISWVRHVSRQRIATVHDLRGLKFSIGVSSGLVTNTHDITASGVRRRVRGKVKEGSLELLRVARASENSVEEAHVRLLVVGRPHLGVEPAGADTVHASELTPVIGERLAEVDKSSCPQIVSLSFKIRHNHLCEPFAAL